MHNIVYNAIDSSINVNKFSLYFTKIILIYKIFSLATKILFLKLPQSTNHIYKVVGETT